MRHDISIPDGRVSGETTPGYLVPTQDLSEGRSVTIGHDVVQNWIHGRLEVVGYAGQEEHPLEDLLALVVVVFVVHRGESLSVEWGPAREESDDDNG